MFRPTVTKAIASLVKAQENLDAVIKKANTVQDKNEAKIAKLVENNLELADEVERASRISDKLAELTS